MLRAELLLRLDAVTDFDDSLGIGRTFERNHPRHSRRSAVQQPANLSATDRRVVSPARPRPMRGRSWPFDRAERFDPGEDFLRRLQARGRSFQLRHAEISNNWKVVAIGKLTGKLQAEQ